MFVKSPRIFLVFTLLILLSACNTSSLKEVVLENDLFSKTITSGENQPAAVQVRFTFNNQPINTPETPWFEFAIGQQKVTALDPLWQFEKQESRSMGNEGTEYQLSFRGVAAPVEGLLLTIHQQIFPGSTLMREKLTLAAEEGKSFQLHKIDGQLHFRFPQYRLPLNNLPEKPSTEIRIASWEARPTTFTNNAGQQVGNHMYYPEVIQSAVPTARASLKGPLHILHTGSLSWLTAYEHASQDNTNGLIDRQKVSADGKIVDATQGIKGKFNFPLQDDDFKFLGIALEKASAENIDVSVDILRGGYLDGEVIDPEHPYSTVWTATGFYDGADLDDGRQMIRHYLFDQICERPASRQPEFYYNTWGMQRQDRNKPLRGILTYENIFREIRSAAQLGVDLFVLDDGWQVTQGVWTPNQERLPQGLAPIKAELDKYGLKMGIWLSPMGIDSTSQRYKDHPEWVVKDSEGKPILAQWDHPAFDFVSGFYELFVQDCKNLVDQGARFFKWDAINTFYSTLPNLEHGTSTYDSAEIRARYEYLLPIYVVRAMEELTAYEPELVIEVDLTEARRVMTGLAPLSQGKLFWMNNGASWFNDYSTFRTKSMRTITNEFAGLVPLELFTFATYPHSQAGAQMYNVNTSLIAGHGFWGALDLMTEEERLAVGDQVAMAKQVLPYLTRVEPQVEGKVGDSPEMYTLIDSATSAGIIVGFSSQPVKTVRQETINPDQLLMVLNHPYQLEGDQLKLEFNFTEPESTCSAFLVPVEDKKYTITASTTALDQLNAEEKLLEYRVRSAGEQTVRWEISMGNPQISPAGYAPEIREEGDYAYTVVRNDQPGSMIRLQWK
jgi:hypothetical protein